MNEQNLTPWKKGQSGNPKGMPKGIKHKKKSLREILDLCIDPSKYKLPISKILQEKYGNRVTIEEAMECAIIAKTLSKGDVSAYNAIKDRLYGKPKQSIDVDTPRAKIVIDQARDLVKKANKDKDNDKE